MRTVLVSAVLLAPEVDHVDAGGDILAGLLTHAQVHLPVQLQITVRAVNLIPHGILLILLFLGTLLVLFVTLGELSAHLLSGGDVVARHEDDLLGVHSLLDEDLVGVEGVRLVPIVVVSTAGRDDDCPVLAGQGRRGQLRSHRAPAYR